VDNRGNVEYDRSIKMAEAQLVYELEGTISEIDVFKLAPTLLSLGNLIQNSNRQLFPDGADLAVNAKPFRAGSFIVDLSLVSSSHIEQLIQFLKPHSVEQLRELLECIGLVAGGAIGAVKAVKALKGKPPRVEDVAPGEFRYTTDDGTSFTVKKSVHALLSNISIVQNIYEIYGPPMINDPSVRSIKTYSEGQEDRAVTVSRSEVETIEDFAESVALLSPEAPEIVRDVVHHDVLLNPKRGAFGNDGRDWSFWRGDGIVTANVKDKSFLEKIASGEYRLNESDLLTVMMVEHRRVIGTAIKKPTYEVVEVTDYKKGPTQIKLPS
jgi:hypothetical protein